MPVEGRPNALPVIFRRYPSRADGSGGDIIALFPTVPSDVAKPHLCASYMHIGQHSAADPNVVMRTTQAAQPAEYRELAKELRGIGYRLVPYRRIQAAHHRERRADWDAMKGSKGSQEDSPTCDDPACGIASMPGECPIHSPAEDLPVCLCNSTGYSKCPVHNPPPPKRLTGLEKAFAEGLGRDTMRALGVDDP